MAIASSFASLRPSLLLDFANAKAVDPRITFTRSTTATYYDGVTTAKAEQNLLTYSQSFENAAWNPVGLTITANTTAAPDGTTTADTINEGTTTGLHNVQQTNFSYVSGTTYTQSVFAKADTATVIQMSMQSTAFGVNAFANYDLSSGALGTVGASATATITSVGNGWYRCTLTATATSTATQNTGFIFLCDNNTAAARALSYTGTSRQLFLWGAQFEQRSSVTAYTPTTTQPITNYIPVLQTAAAGVPRIDHNPTTGECLGLLIEEQRTNLLTYSEEFNNAAWVKVNATITANTVIAPDGTTTADIVIPNGALGQHRVDRSTTTTAAPHAWSVFVKAAGYGFTWIRIGSLGAVFDLSTGAISSISVGVTASVTQCGNGWLRCSVSCTAVANDTVRINALSTASIADFSGDGYSGVYIWGAQLEAGAFPTSYIPTVATQETRNADAASMTGTNFSSWFNNGEGTLFAELMQFGANTQMFPLGALGASTNQISLYFPASSSGGLYVVNNGVAQANMTGSPNSIPANTFGKVAGAYRADDFAISVQGATASTDTSGTVPVADRLLLRSSGSFIFRKIAYYPQRLSNTNLQALTV